MTRGSLRPRDEPRSVLRRSVAVPLDDFRAGLRTFTWARVKFRCKGHSFAKGDLFRPDKEWKGDKMRTKIMLLALITVAVSLVAASLATAQATFKLKAAMNIGQETSRVKGAKAGAGRALHRDARRHHAEVDAHVQDPLRSSDRCAHSYGTEGCSRLCHRSAMHHPVHVTCERDDRAYGGSGKGPAGREGLHERSHRKEPRRRNSRANYQGAHEVEVAPSRHEEGPGESPGPSAVTSFRTSRAPTTGTAAATASSSDDPNIGRVIGRVIGVR